MALQEVTIYTLVKQAEEGQSAVCVCVCVYLLVLLFAKAQSYLELCVICLHSNGRRWGQLKRGCVSD